jgi:hypothetical protein
MKNARSQAIESPRYRYFLESGSDQLITVANKKTIPRDNLT